MIAGRRLYGLPKTAGMSLHSKKKKELPEGEEKIIR
jgi:hypothetical protein